MSDCFDRAPGAGRGQGRGRGGGALLSGSGAAESGARLGGSGFHSSGPAEPQHKSGFLQQQEPLRPPKTAPPGTGNAEHMPQTKVPPVSQDKIAAHDCGSAMAKPQLVVAPVATSKLSVNAPEFYPSGYNPSFTDSSFEDGCDGYPTLTEYVQDFLNHLTEQPGCFETEIEHFAETLNGWVTTDEALQELVELIYRQATSVPNFSYMGARLCNYLSHHLTINPQSGNFRQLLLQRCRTEYENRDQAAKGDEATRKQFHAFVLFLAELYLNLEIKGTKGQVMRAEILQTGLRELLNALFSNPVDNNLICAVKLLKLTGSVLEDAWKEKGKTDMDEMVQRIENVVLDANCSRDVKQMLLKLVELRSSNWGRVHVTSTYREATPENDPNYFMNEPTFYTSEGVPFTAADPDYQEKYQELLDREDFFPDYEENGTDLSGAGDPYFDDIDDEMDPEIEEAYEKFCLESEQSLFSRIKILILTVIFALGHTESVNDTLIRGSLRHFPFTAMKPESLMILYEDDSVEVYYIDGSRLLLSPCGSEFLFEKALPVSAHPLQPAERIRQRTQFVISTYREQLLRAIDFRNQFCSSLYLPSSIIPSERKNILLSDISEINWPSPNATDAAECMDNGSVKISSLDGHAYLCMSELQQEFTVEFLCKVSQKCAASSSFSEKNSNNQKSGQHGKSSRSFISEMFPKQMRMENKKEEHCWTINKCRELDKSKGYLNQIKGQDEAPLSLTCCSSEYVWVMQRWSVSSYPEEWKYPLSLALMFYQLHTDNICKTYVENKCTRNGTAGSDVLKESEKTKAVSHLPRALPLSCSAPHLHRWRFCDFFLQRKQESEHNSCPLLIKIVWCQGIIYRLIHDIENFIEIYPGDGSVFKSEGAFLGNYFTHYSVHKETRQREEKMYSANSLPPDTPESPYSICSIITQATRILQYCYKTKLSLTHNYNICCWRMIPGTDGREMLPVPLHETVIPNVGRLVAYSDNKVHALFCDGMTLNMVWDFSSCYGRTQINQGATTGWCKVISPDGAQQLIQINHPGLYERYIKTVVAWCRSLNDDEGETLPATERNWSVVAELEKIQRFNFLLQNSNVPNKTSAMKNNPSHITDRRPENSLPEDIGERSISEALEKTSKVIQDIESLLASSEK